MGNFQMMSESLKDYFRITTALFAIFGFLFLFSCGTEYNDVTYTQPQGTSDGGGDGDSGGYGVPDSLKVNP